MHEKRLTKLLEQYVDQTTVLKKRAELVQVEANALQEARCTLLADVIKFNPGLLNVRWDATFSSYMSGVIFEYTTPGAETPEIIELIRFLGFKTYFTVRLEHDIELIGSDWPDHIKLKFKSVERAAAFFKKNEFRVNIALIKIAAAQKHKEGDLYARIVNAMEAVDVTG